MAPYRTARRERTHPFDVRRCLPRAAERETSPADPSPGVRNAACYGAAMIGRPVLVTGGAGFVGSHLCDRLLAEGHAVVAVDELTSGRRENLANASEPGVAFTFTELDVRSEGLLDVFTRHQPDIVMHLAAQAGVRPSLDDPGHDASVNIMGTLNVLKCASTVGSRKVVYAASGGTLYGEPTTVPVRESAADGAHPESPYGISKKVVLEYLNFYSRQRGLDFTAVALGNVYGPRQDPTGEAGVIAIFASSMLAKKSATIFGDGEQTRDYVYVEDTVEAFVAAMDRASREIVNIGTGLETSVNTLHAMLAEIIGTPSEPAHGPQPEGELRRIALDNTLAASVLGWSPRTDLSSGLTRTVEHLRGRHPASSG
jgi:UDP-glucose 4-epimerase